MLISQPKIMLRNIQWGTFLLRICNGFLSLFPMVSCSAILTWAIYALVCEVCYHQLYINYKHQHLGWLVAIFGTILYCLCIYTYFMVIIRGGGSPLDFAELKIRNLDLLKANSSGGSTSDEANDSNDINEDQNLLEQDFKDTPPTDYVFFHTTKPGVSPYRYCMKCKVWKPDRCHHCSSCNRCILRMDHHCPWFASCIGYHNQKYFIQNLAYIATFSGYCFFALGAILLDFFQAKSYQQNFLSLNLVFLFIIGLVFLISVGLFGLFLMWLVTKNTTTIEFQERSSGDKFQYEFDGKNKKVNIYDLGKLNNWKSIMGNNWLYWVTPVGFTQKSIESPVNGVNFAVDEEVYEEFLHNTRLQEQLNRQLQDYRDSMTR